MVTEANDKNQHIYVSPRYVDTPAICYFYHTIDLPEFGIQKGGWDLRGRFEDYIGHVLLKGKRVLDVGAATGFLSFEAERCGASEVVSFDLDGAERQTLLPFAESEYVKDNKTWCAKQSASFETWKNSYWLTHRLIQSSTRVAYGDVYNINPGLGQFDVIILGAILEHLIDPLTAMRSIARHAADLIVINTDFADDPRPMALFNGRSDLPELSYVFWTYSISAYHEYMAILGFEPVTVQKNSFSAWSPPEKKYVMIERVALVYKRRVPLEKGTA